MNQVGDPISQPTRAPDVSVVVPVFDEEENLPILVEEITRALVDVEVWELILVDDGSRDRSVEVMQALRATCGVRLRVLVTPRNQGQSAALVAGFRAARGDVVVTLDADLQNDPADIPKLLALIEEGADMVSGIRQKRRDTLARRVASRVANRVRRVVVGDPVHDVGCSLKAYRRRVLQPLPAFDGLHRFLPALVTIQGGVIRELPVHHRPRRHGESKYTIGGRLRRSLFDLFGVRWLQSRFVDPGIVYELGDEKTGL